RGNLLGKEAIRRSCWQAPRGGMRLVQKAALFQFGHHVANGRGAQSFLKARAYSPRRDRLSCLDVRAHYVRQNLTVTPFLERSGPHLAESYSTCLLHIVGTQSSSVNARVLLACCSSGPRDSPSAEFVQNSYSTLSICARWSLPE